MLQCDVACCSVLQRVAACCSVLQCDVVCCSVFQRVAACCSVLQCVAVCCSVLQCVAGATDTSPVTWLIKMCDMIHKHVCDMSQTIIHMSERTQSYM